jgi:hypothetical protein
MLKYNFVQIGPVGAELLHADGRTDMTKLIVAFRKFAKAPKIRIIVKQKDDEVFILS